MRGTAAGLKRSHEHGGYDSIFIYWRESEPERNRIIAYAPDGEVVSVAEGGTPKSEAQLACPCRIALGPDGSMYITEHNPGRIRRVDPAGIIAIVAISRVPRDIAVTPVTRGLRRLRDGFETALAQFTGLVEHLNIRTSAPSLPGLLTAMRLEGLDLVLPDTVMPGDGNEATGGISTWRRRRSTICVPILAQ